MFQKIVSEISLLQFYIAFTAINAFFLADYKKKEHISLLVMLTGFVFSEIVITYSIAADIYNEWIYPVTTTIYNTIWLFLLFKVFKKRNLYYYLILFNLIFCLTDMIFWEGIEKFNIYSFVVGAGIYMFIFIKEYLKQLNSENFAFFQINESLLLFTPLPFFMAVSIMFGFNDNKLSNALIIGNIHLYDVAVNFANIISYSIINIYFFKEKQLRK